MSSASKGSLAGSIPLLVMLVSTSIFAVQSMSIGQSLSEEVVKSVDDLSRTAEAKSSQAFFFFDYGLQGGKLSVHQQTYELGQEGGGVEWESSDLNLRDDIQANLDGTAETYLNDKYLDTTFSGLECFLENDNYLLVLPDIEDALATPHIKGDIWTTQLITSCNFENGDLESRSGEASVRNRYSAKFNRFPQIVDQAIKFNKRLREAWNNMDLTYSGSATACGYAPYGEAEENARRKAAQALLQVMVNVEDPENGIVVEREVESFEYTEVNSYSYSVGDCDPEDASFDEEKMGKDSLEFESNSSKTVRTQAPPPTDECLDAPGCPEARNYCTTSSSGESDSYYICADVDLDPCLEKLPNIQTCSGDQVCDSGECVERTCEDDPGCETAGRTCSGSTSFYRCRDTDSDPCLEKGPTVACDPDTECSGGYCEPEDTGGDKIEANVEIRITEADALLTYYDTFYRVITEEGWERLELVVDTYTHDF